MAKPSVDLLQGTLDVLILKTLSWGPMHGYGITRSIQRITDDVLRIEEGSMYPALYRMENRSLVKAEWAVTENNRRAKYYKLTAAGRKRLAEESATWSLFSEAVARVLRATAQPG